jgi:hypothetical protein
MGEKRNAYRILVESQKQRVTRKKRRRWVDNIKMGLRDTGWGGMNWMDLAKDRDQGKALVNTVMNLWVP